MIDEVDFEDRGGGLDGPSGVVIGQAGFGFSTWVIVSQDKCVGVWRRRQGVGPRVDDDRLRKSAEADEVPADDGVADIEQDACEPCGGRDVLLPEGLGRSGVSSVGTGWSVVDPEHADLAGTEIEAAVSLVHT